MNRSLGHARLDDHFGRRLVRGTDDEISLGVGRRNFAVGQFLGRDEARRMRIAPPKGLADRRRKFARQPRVGLTKGRSA